jgi:DNA polymerase-3 subunit epsilon
VNIIFLDLETTGFLDEEPFRITEIAWAVYCLLSRRIVKCHSAIINELPEHYEMEPHIFELTGLDSSVVAKYGGPLSAQIAYLKPYMESAMCMFQRGDFDEKALSKECQRLKLELPEKVWINDVYDIDYPASFKGRHLSHVAADHGFLNPFAHTAMGDVMTLIKVMQMGGYDLEDAYESAKSPVVAVQALVSFDNKDLAKQAGFTWDAEHKIWFKRMREHRVQETVVVGDWQFKTRILK